MLFTYTVVPNPQQLLLGIKCERSDGGYGWRQTTLPRKRKLETLDLVEMSSEQVEVPTRLMLVLKFFNISSPVLVPEDHIGL